MSKPILILALDIETNGPNLLKNEIISLGFCSGDMNGNNIYKKKINFKYTTEFEEECFKFWSKYPKVLNNLSLDQVDPHDGIKEFIEYVDLVDSKYELRIVTDNPSFDISFINYYLNKYLDRLPINYIHGIGNNYRCIYDTDSYSRGAMNLNYNNPWTIDSLVIKKFGLKKISADHSHNPDEDAEYIYKIHIALITELQKRNKF